jgi:non-canonical (house-cleaning) NTP pyrophosphatase
MKTIIVTSKNPIEIKAIKNAFAQMFTDQMFKSESTDILSDVSHQPKSDEEVLKGAENRARNAKQKSPSAYYCVGIEGGIEDTEYGMTVFA